MTHTKGKWELDGDVISNGEKYICQMYWDKNEKETEANAKLIAAAPELLEALEEINMLCAETIREGWHARLDRIQDKAWKAIKKAQ